jgi:hypothetical protein
MNEFTKLCHRHDVSQTLDPALRQVSLVHITTYCFSSSHVNINRPSSPHIANGLLSSHYIFVHIPCFHTSVPHTSFRRSKNEHELWSP